MAVSFITFFSYSSGSILYHCIYGCTFFMFLFNFVNYVSNCYVLLVMFMYSYSYVCSILGILFHCVFCVLSVCNCVPYYHHRASTQLQLVNISHKSLSNKKINAFQTFPIAV